MEYIVAALITACMNLPELKLNINANHEAKTQCIQRVANCSAYKSYNKVLTDCAKEVHL